ncbi:MAG: hypothetical protein AAF203_04240, partial [Pseudomonadota bacterium]
FIESGYLYGVSKRHAQMVNNDDEYFLDLEYIDHGKWVEFFTIEDFYSSGSTVSSVDTYELFEDNRWEDMHDILFADSWAPFFCGTFLDDPWFDDSRLKECKDKTQKLFGDALYKADVVRGVIVDGNEWGDYRHVVVTMADFETKETITLIFDILHEI